jgi:Hemerythrin HHE cation binding domain
MESDTGRREVLKRSWQLGLVAAASCIPIIGYAEEKKAADKEPEVTATEDLMREHGVIRRALLVYAETVPKLRQNAASVDGNALRQTAQLFRTFGEDYHERMLEEEHIFPLIRKQGSKLQTYADVLTAQHHVAAR